MSSPMTENLTALTHVSLPSPAQNPEADIVVYDGHCKFCTAQVKRLARWDARRQLAFLSLHDAGVSKLLPDVTYDQLMHEMYLVDRAGHRHRGAAAFRYLTTRLPRLYPLAPLLHIPFSLPLWRWAYQQIARRRYWIMGKTAEACTDDSCRVHLK